MQIGMVGLGRMGANMVRRMIRAGHECVVYDVFPKAVAEMTAEKAVGSSSMSDLVGKLKAPRAVWMMVPAAVVEETISGLVQHLEPGDVLIDGGNSWYGDDIRRAKELKKKQLHYVDVGTSGGVWGLERGYCMMIGGDSEAVQRLDPIFRALAPGMGDLPRTPGRGEAWWYRGAGIFALWSKRGRTFRQDGSQRDRVRHHGFVCRGPGRFARRRCGKEKNNLTPRRRRCVTRSNISMTSTCVILRRYGVAGALLPWLLDLTAEALVADHDLSKFGGRVSDSGEGRWTIKAAIDEAVPVPVLSAALYQRFASRGEADYQDKLLSAMRFGFGGHLEKPAGK